MYRWKAYNQFDIIRNLERRGHIVDEIEGEMANFEEDDFFLQQFRVALDNEKYDMVITVNYFPIISDECQRRNIRYVSWCCDSPISTMYNESVFNEVNTIFTFDKWNQIEFEDKGAPVFYLPLCADTERVDSIIREKGNMDGKYSHDVAFVGSMYNKNLFDEVYDNFSDYEKGYFDAALKMQVQVYGEYLLDEILDAKIMSDINRHFILAKSERSFQNLSLTFSTTVLSYKIAQIERQQVLSRLAEKFNVDIYTDDKKYEYARVKKHGTVDYWEEAPIIYHNSKVNLNFTLRSIRTGIPLRVWDILASGGFCITNYQPELLMYFENGKDIVIFESIDDLENKIEYYLKHEDERKSIAENGYNKVKLLHQYQNRFDNMKKYIPEI